MDSRSVVRDTLLDGLCIVQMVDVAAAALAPGQLQQGEDLLVEGDVASPVEAAAHHGQAEPHHQAHRPGHGASLQCSVLTVSWRASQLWPEMTLLVRVV